MLERIKIVCAYLKCHFYLLTHGMWKGDVEVTYYKKGKIERIQTERSDIPLDIPTRVFYQREIK